MIWGLQVVMLLWWSKGWRSWLQQHLQIGKANIILSVVYYRSGHYCMAWHLTLFELSVRNYWRHIIEKLVHMNYHKYGKIASIWIGVNLMKIYYEEI